MATADSLTQKLQGWWLCSLGRSLKAILAHLLPLLICWELWKVRNKAIYENIRASPAHIYRQVIWLLNVIGVAHPFISSSPEDISSCHLGLIPFLRQSRIAMINTLVWFTPS